MSFVTCGISGVLYAFPLTPLLTAVLGRIRAQVAVLQLPSEIVISACSTPLSRSFSPPAGEFPAPLLHTVHASCLDVVREGYRGQGFFDRCRLPGSDGTVFNEFWDISVLESGTFSVLGVQ